MADKYNKIIEGCIEEHRSAQETLYNTFSTKMYGVCLRYATDQDQAQDVLQEGFIKVFSKIRQFKGGGSFEGWIRRIMVNTALEKLRVKNYTYSIEENPVAYKSGKEDNIISNITSQDLMKIINELSPQYKTVFNLYAIEGYSHKEIGKMLGISEGTSKSNLSRARNILQKQVSKYYEIATKIG